MKLRLIGKVTYKQSNDLLPLWHLECGILIAALLTYFIEIEKNAWLNISLIAGHFICISSMHSLFIARLCLSTHIFKIHIATCTLAHLQTMIFCFMPIHPSIFDTCFFCSELWRSDGACPRPHLHVLGWWEKVGEQGRTYTGTVRTCKLHTRRLQDRNWVNILFAPGLLNQCIPFTSCRRLSSCTLKNAK